MATIEPISLPRGNRSPKTRSVYYPTGDGKPMAEDSLHRDLMSDSIPALKLHFADRSDVYISGNDFLYYQEGHPKVRVSPDCYVVIGVQKRRRKFYKVWEENGITPAVIFEFTSKATQKEDVEIKRPLYEQVLRVQEYFQFDPTGDYLHPRLQGQRLQQGRYEPIELRNDRMFSEHPGLELVIQNEWLRFYDPARHEWLRTLEEAEAQRKAAESELAKLRAELEALRRQK